MDDLVKKNIEEIISKKKSVTTTAKELSVSRQTVYKWIASYKKNKRSTRSISEKKEITAHNKIAPKTENLVISLAKRYQNESVVSLSKRLQNTYGVLLNGATIFRILKRNNIRYTSNIKNISQASLKKHLSRMPKIKSVRNKTSYDSVINSKENILSKEYVLPEEDVEEIPRIRPASYISKPEEVLSHFKFATSFFSLVVSLFVLSSAITAMSTGKLVSSLLSENKNNLTTSYAQNILGNTTHKVASVGSNLHLFTFGSSSMPVPEKILFAFSPRVYSFKNIDSWLDTGVKTALSTAPSELVTKDNFTNKNYLAFILGGRIANGATSISSSKRNLPFVDQLSLSIFCSLASLSTTVDKSRCDYNFIASGINTITPENITKNTQPEVTPFIAVSTSTQDTTIVAHQDDNSKSASPIYVTKYVTEYIPVPGPAGRDGVDGKNGRDASNSPLSVQGSFGGFITPPSYSPTPQSLIGVSTIGYLRGTTIEYANFSYGTSTNMYLSNANIATSVFNGLNTFNDTALFTGNVAINSLTATSSNLLNTTLTNSTTTNAVTTNATTTNSYITNLSNDNAVVTNSTTTNAVVTNSTTTNAFISSLNAVLINLTNLLTTNATTTNLFATSSNLINTNVTNASTTNSTTTNQYITNLTTLNASSTNGTSTNFFTQNLSVGNGTVSGNQTINGVLTVNGSTTLASNTLIAGSVVLGTSTSNNITVNGLFASSLIPNSNNTVDIGSPSFFWRNGYVNSLMVNTLSAGSTTISGTQSSNFTINTDNVTTDSEDASLIFYRGTVPPNAVIKWNATTKRFEFNQSTNFQDETPSTGSTTLSVQAGQGQSTKNLFQILNNAGTVLSFFNASGALGVGTTTVGTSMLSVNGNAYIGGNVTATGTLNVAGQTTLTNASSTGLTVTGGTYLATSGGSVGVGTTNPDNTLDVRGSVAISTGNALKLYNAARNGWAQLRFNEAADTIEVQRGIQDSITSNNFKLSLSSSSPSYINAQTGFLGVGTTTPIATLSVASSTANGTASLFSINGLSSVFNVLGNGYVGIGTTTPESVLHVNAPSGQVIFSTLGNSTETNDNMGVEFRYGNTYPGGDYASRFVKADQGSGVPLYLQTNETGDRITWVNTVRFGSYGTNSNKFQTFGQTSLASNAGSVGIGTTTPTYKLSINSTDSTTNLFQIATTTNQGVFNVRANGNVGIGIANPASPLSVYKTGSSQGSISASEGNFIPVIDANDFMFGQSSVNGNNVIGGDVSRDLLFTSWNGTNPVENMRITSAGRIGIGTSTPGNQMVVTGTNVVSSIISNSGTLASLQLYTPNANRWGLNSDSATSPGFGIYDYTNSAYRFVIASSTGYIGVGTTTPISALTVSGTSTLVGSATSPTALRVIGNVDNTQGGGVNPKVVGSVNTVTSPNTVITTGRYSYVLNGAGTSQVQVIDSSNPTSPTVLSTYTLTKGSQDTFTIVGKYAYFINQVGGDFLEVVDISNPKSLATVSTLNVGATNLFGIVGSGKYLYVSSYTANAIKVIDIGNPANPVVVGTVSTDSHPSNMAISGKYLYVSNVGTTSMQTIDVSNPSSPTVTGVVTVGTTVIGTGFSNIAVSGRYVYIANSSSNNMQVIDVSSSTLPTVVGTVNTDTTPAAITVAGRYVYVVNSGTGSMQMVDVSNPASPTVVGTVTTGSAPKSVAVSGRYAYVLNSTSGTLQVVDVNGVETTSAIVHSLDVGNLSVRNDIFTQGSVNIGTGLTVSGGVSSNGNLSVFGTGGTTNSIFSVASSTSSQLFNVLANGNVGIGTTSPSYLLSVETSATTGTKLSLNNSSTGGQNFVLTSSGSGNSMGAGSLVFGTLAPSTASNLMVLTSTGNLGIATTTPLGKLDVNGDVYITGTNRYITIKGDGNTSVGGLKIDVPVLFGADKGVNFEANGANGQRIVYTGDFAFNGSSTKTLAGSSVASLIIKDTTGNVGIGTTTPQAKLDIVGGIRIASANSIKINTAGVSSAPSYLYGDVYETNITTNTTGSFGAGYGIPANSAIGSWKMVLGGGADVGADYFKVSRAPATSSTPSFVDFFQINGSGNVGIGVSPLSLLHIQKTSGDTSLGVPSNSALTLSQGGAINELSQIGLGYTTSNASAAAIAYITTDAASFTNGAITFATRSVTTDTVPTERMRITSAGNVSIGTTTANQGYYLQINTVSGNKVQLGLNDSDTSSTSYHAADFLRGGIAVGSISTTNTATAFNTSSDMRLKENIIPTHYGLSDLMNIQVKDFSFISDSTHTMQNGFLAQQLETIYPNAVTVGGADPSKNPWMVDYGRLSPLLVKSIQELSYSFDNLSSSQLSFYTPSEALDLGTVIAFSDVSTSTIKKATNSSEAIGIVTTSTNTSTTTAGIPVAFSGKVTVQVTNENGTIHKGDYLTVSTTTPGKAERLTQEGQSLGRALTDDDGTGRITMVLNTGYQKVDTSSPTATTTGMLTTGNLDLNANAVAIYNIKSLASANGSWSIDENGRITAKVLCLDATCIDGGGLSSVLAQSKNAGSVVVVQNFAYILNTKNHTLRTLDITNPGAPTEITTLTLGDDAATISQSGSYLYITNNDTTKIYLVDITSPRSPNLVSSIATDVVVPSILPSVGVTNTGDTSSSTVTTSTSTSDTSLTASTTPPVSSTQPDASSTPTI